MAGEAMQGIGPMLRAWRERTLLTQDELAERSHVSVRTIRRLECGATGVRPRSSSLRQLADALGLHDEEQAALIEAVRGTPRPEPQMSALPAMSVPPRQLPTPPLQLTGRVADLARLELDTDHAKTVLLGIDGMAGVGKTHLALHAAHRWAPRYPDGQLFLDLQGCTQGTPPVQPGDALRRLLHSLGVPAARIPDGLDDRAAFYRSCLAGRRTLILLDNAASEGQITPLLPGSPGCLVVITSRRSLPGLNLDLVHSLGLPSLSEAVSMFVRASAAHHTRADPLPAVNELVELCGRLPLAIRIAAARLRSRPSWTVEDLTERLRCQRQRLRELAVGGRSVAAVLDASYAQLEPRLRHAYRMLGVHQGVEMDLAVAAALVGQDSTEVRRMLDQLLDNHLLQEPSPGRYRFHELTRAHAARVAYEETSEHDRHAAMRRLFAHHWRSARHGGRIESTGQPASADVLTFPAIHPPVVEEVPEDPVPRHSGP